MRSNQFIKKIRFYALICIIRYNEFLSSVSPSSTVGAVLSAKQILIFSDVMDDSLETIASGIAAPDPYSLKDVKKIIKKTKNLDCHWHPRVQERESKSLSQDFITLQLKQKFR